MNNNTLGEKLIQYAADMLCAISKEGYFIKVSGACGRILGYNSHELEGRHYTAFLHPADKAATLQAVHQLHSGYGTQMFQNRYFHKDGRVVPIAWSVTRTEEESTLFCTARDASPQNKLRKTIADREAFYNALLGYGSDLLTLLDMQGNYLYVSGATARMLGYEPEQLVGSNLFNHIHKEDTSKVLELWSQLGSSELIDVKDLRFKTAKGEWRWVEIIISDQLQNPAIRALVVSSRDITSYKARSLKLQENEQRYRSLFENNPDMVMFEDREGLVTEVNEAFRAVLGDDLEHVIGKPASSFLPSEMAAVNERSREEALRGSTLRYDLELTSKGKRRSIFDAIKFPVLVNGEAIGVQTIVTDITAIVRSFETIEKQVKKLNTIFESITDAFIALDKDWKLTYINGEAERLFQIKRRDYLGKNIWEKFPDNTSGEFYKKCQHAAASGETVQFEAYYESLAIWLQIKAFPSEEGLAIYFDDITEIKKSRQENEKLSLVASKTDNGVVITDATGLTEWVNAGFTRITGYTLSEMEGKKPGDILQGAETDPEAVKRIRENLKQGNHFNAKLINYRKSGERFWISMDITPIYDEAGIITQFIAIQRDITDRKETEVDFLQMTQDLYRQNNDLREFTYIVSHNLRGPVANALGLANMLTRIDKNSKTFTPTLAHLKTSIERMDTVLRDVNTILSVREKQDVLEIEEVSLTDVFGQACRQLQEPLLQANAEVKVGVEEGLSIRANKAFLFSIFYNLLSNALKFRSEEHLLQVTLNSSRNTDGSLVVSFSDNGIGFNREKAGNEVFKLYKRFHLDKKGRGMGLFLVKAHVEAMGWRIEVRSEVNEGTTFLIYLPG